MIRESGRWSLDNRKATAPVQFRQALEGLIGMAVFAMKVKPEATRGTGPLESGQRKAETTM
ncbi:hypothetical protein M4S82_06625 [Planococcus sp. MERTA32b]|nr:hypothetical protein [Planococcus sp. MER TA 32b]